MHSNMHLLHLHVTAVIAPPSPLPPLLVGSPSCKASRPIAQRGVQSCLAGSSAVVCMEAEKKNPILSMVSRLLCSLCMKAFHASRTCSYLHCIYSSHMILVSLFRVFEWTPEPPLALGLASHLLVLVTKPFLMNLQNWVLYQFTFEHLYYL